MKNPKVSVIIPVYNGEKTLSQCLASVLSQSYRNYEVILVDNNSTDKTKSIIKEFQKENKKVVYLFEKERKRGAARNTGEKKAKGEIILMTDSDCIVPKNWIKEMIKLIIENKCIAVGGIKKPIKLNYWTKNIQEESERINKERLKDNKIGLLDTANFAIKKSVLKKIGYTNPGLFSGNDIELMSRLKAKGYPICFQKFSVLHYHPDTFLKVFKKYFKRAEWYYKIRKMHSANKNLFSDSNKHYHLCYLSGLVAELLTLKKRFLYDFTTGVAWRLGTFYGWLTK